jgi:hypothetical protein
MIVVLDTDHMTLLHQPESEPRQRLVARLERARPTRLATTVVTYEEQTRGWLAKLSKAKEIDDLAFQCRGCPAIREPRQAALPHRHHGPAHCRHHLGPRRHAAQPQFEGLSKGPRPEG